MAAASGPLTCKLMELGDGIARGATGRTQKVESILDVDFSALATAGVTTVFMDVDNTLTRPGEARIDRDVVDYLVRARTGTGIAKWAVASNSWRNLGALADSIDAVQIERGWFCAKPRLGYFRRALASLAADPGESVMIGDKLLHDIVPAQRVGMHTILVRPRYPDGLSDRLLAQRWRERRFIKADSARHK
jgi:putative phosphatase